MDSGSSDAEVLELADEEKNERYAFLDDVDIKDEALAPHLNSYGIARLDDEEEINLVQFNVNVHLLKALKICGSNMPKSRFSGRAGPVWYTEPTTSAIQPMLPLVKQKDKYRHCTLQELFDQMGKNVRALSPKFDEKFSQKYSFLITDTQSNRMQLPHTDIAPLEDESKIMLLGFMPLSEHGMFLEVWRTHKAGEDPVKGNLVHVPYGTMTLIDSSVVHAGGICFGDDPNLRVQFAFANHDFPLYQTQIKGSETEYKFNVAQRVEKTRVCEEFSVFNEHASCYYH